MRVGGTFKAEERAKKAAHQIRKEGYKVDVKELTKGFGLYKYNLR